MFLQHILYFSLITKSNSMNPSDQISNKDEASRNIPEASSSNLNNEIISTDNKNEVMKRAAAKKLIERYFYQLTDGCGNPHCDNQYCASSGELKPLTPDEAAAQAIQLFSQDARLCDRHPNKIARKQGNIINNKNDTTNDVNFESDSPRNDIESQSNYSNSKESLKYNTPIPTYLTEQALYDIIDECEANNSYSPLIRTVGEIFSSIENLSKSFPQEPSTPTRSSSNLENADIKSLKKEDVRSLEGEKDKDEDSSAESNKNSLPPVDIPAVRRAYTALFKLNSSIFENALVNALVTLAGNLQMELPMRKESGSHDDIVNVLVIVFEIPALGSGDLLETALPAICRAAQRLPVEVQASLAIQWSGVARRSIRSILENLQQLITLRVIMTPFQRDFFVQDENVITSATKFMKILYYANMLAGVLESPELRYQSLSDTKDGFKPQSTLPPDPLAEELGIHVLDCRKPYLPFSEFYNEPLSDAVEMDRDFANYKSDTGKFSFMHYPFILTPATKTMGLYFDNRIRMYSERRISFLQTFTGLPSQPFLKLKVRRDHIIDDALVELEMISMDNPSDLKKQLVVEFEGEQGIDEGGVSKEFFQLVIEEIFNPDYAMFSIQPESQTVWFNPTSFESDAQFTLIGIVLGLAIYNNVILAVNFPMVLYRKLMGKRGSFEDLQDWTPVLYNSLKQLLEYHEPNFEDMFMLTFRISYQDVFGSTISYDLKENGDKISVTQENKYEFVDLYADFLLNKSVEKQFSAFYKGFQMVVDESPLELLFRPEEIELLICGSKNFDFDELEHSTEYDGGYTNESQIIKDFWSVVHALSLEDKRKLLQFTTGSDRVPIGGLSRLKLVIAKNGPDSDRLPTAHTCFNVLLLPEYSSKTKLKDRLVKAINYSKGFGML
ncbi:ubiquitin-protein ligase E3A isoform X1 [Diorhabda carinulata]|uniref:ubiquitin-protein ligase E3A isoform X1 n=2 Tax=Diorhabda carinulata TaxID=1163345 RepID=UPI0025A2AB86|nr:ubiquitin-protein ligase E3A isoform X1 [Diorhabda carinulata]